MAPPEMDRDRLGPGIQALIEQPFAQLDDLVFDLDRGAQWAPPWSPGPRFEPVLPFGIEAPAELEDLPG